MHIIIWRLMHAAVSKNIYKRMENHKHEHVTTGKYILRHAMIVKVKNFYEPDYMYMCCRLVLTNSSWGTSI